MINGYIEKSNEIIEYDSYYPKVFATVKDLLSKNFPSCEIIHFGSTAIKRLPGKGVIDILLLISDDDFKSAVLGIESLGFHYPSFRKAPMPEQKPFRVGSIQLNGVSYNLHCHIALRESVFHKDAVRVVNTLSNSSELREQYIRYKYRALDLNLETYPEYNAEKGKFFIENVDKIFTVK